MKLLLKTNTRKRRRKNPRLLRLASLTKVYNRKGDKSIDYAPSENILEELRILEKQKGLLIFDNLKILLKGNADSFSLTKDKPYNYFYARITDENIILKMKTRENDTEFRIPLEEFNKL